MQLTWSSFDQYTKHELIPLCYEGNNKLFVLTYFMCCLHCLFQVLISSSGIGNRSQVFNVPTLLKPTCTSVVGREHHFLAVSCRYLTENPILSLYTARHLTFLPFSYDFLCCFGLFMFSSLLASICHSKPMMVRFSFVLMFL